MKYKYYYFIIFFFFFLSCENGGNTTNQPEIIEEKKQNVVDSSDIIIFQKIIQYSKENTLSTKTLPEIEIAIARYLLGTPYVAKTLEKAGEEHLVVNLREFDCTTFLENVVSLSSCIKNKTISLDDFIQTLTKFRYRNGVIDKYPSRLHYFTDWLLDNEKNQLITIVSNSFATDDFDPTVNFMSKHPQYYEQLKNDTFLSQIVEIEKKISKAKLKFIPKAKIKQYEKHIQDGDIIAITTTIDGLDIAHVGMAIFVNNRLHLFHASSKQKKVVISKIPLDEYLKDFKKKNGIIVARVK